MRDSEPAAESLGVRVSDYKLQALVVSAIYASVAGSLYAHYMIFISPTAFDLDVSVRLVLMAAVGGLASVWGAPLGATAVLLLSLVLREIALGHQPHQLRRGAQIMAYGMLLVVIMIFMPEGLTAAIARAWRRTGGVCSLAPPPEPLVRGGAPWPLGCRTCRLLRRRPSWRSIASHSASGGCWRSTTSLLRCPNTRSSRSSGRTARARQRC